MNNGQTQRDDGYGFFTEGAGKASPDANNVELENNLNPTNLSGNNNDLRNHQPLGSAAAKVANNIPDVTPTIVEAGANSSVEGVQSENPRMGEIVNLEMPPGPENATQEEKSNKPAPEINHSKVQTTNGTIEIGGKLEKELTANIIDNYGKFQESREKYRNALKPAPEGTSNG